jgi:hypothetical protein
MFSIYMAGGGVVYTLGTLTYYAFVTNIQFQLTLGSRRREREEKVGGGGAIGTSF